MFSKKKKQKEPPPVIEGTLSFGRDAATRPPWHSVHVQLKRDGRLVFLNATSGVASSLPGLEKPINLEKESKSIGLALAAQPGRKKQDVLLKVDLKGTHSPMLFLEYDAAKRTQWLIALSHARMGPDALAGDLPFVHDGYTLVQKVGDAVALVKGGDGEAEEDGDGGGEEEGGEGEDAAAEELVQKARDGIEAGAAIATSILGPSELIEDAAAVLTSLLALAPFAAPVAKAADKVFAAYKLAKNNKDDCAKLANRVKMMLITVKQVVQSCKEAYVASHKGLPDPKPDEWAPSQLAEFSELLDEASEFIAEFGARGFIVRMLKSSKDSRAFKDYDDRLTKVVADMSLHLQGINMSAMSKQFAQVHKGFYEESARTQAAVQAAVAAAAGVGRLETDDDLRDALETVRANPEKMAALEGKLGDIGVSVDDLRAEMSAFFEEALAAVAALSEKMENGPARLIRHAALRSVWTDYCKAEQVMWTTFVSVLRTALMKINNNADLLSTANVAHLQRYIDRDRNDKVAVTEVSEAFDSMPTSNLEDALREAIALGSAEVIIVVPAAPEPFFGYATQVKAAVDALLPARTAADATASPPTELHRLVIVEAPGGAGMTSFLCAIAHSVHNGELPDGTPARGYSLAGLGGSGATAEAEGHKCPYSSGIFYVGVSNASDMQTAMDSIAAKVGVSASQGAKHELIANWAAAQREAGSRALLVLDTPGFIDGLGSFVDELLSLGGGCIAALWGRVPADAEGPEWGRAASPPAVGTRLALEGLSPDDARKLMDHVTEANGTASRRKDAAARRREDEIADKLIASSKGLPKVLHLACSAGLAVWSSLIEDVASVSAAAAAGGAGAATSGTGAGAGGSRPQGRGKATATEMVAPPPGAELSARIDQERWEALGPEVRAAAIQLTVMASSFELDAAIAVVANKAQELSDAAAADAAIDGSSTRAGATATATAGAGTDGASSGARGGGEDADATADAAAAAAADAVGIDDIGIIDTTAVGEESTEQAEEHAKRVRNALAKLLVAGFLQPAVHAPASASHAASAHTDGGVALTARTLPSRLVMSSRHREFIAASQATVDGVNSAVRASHHGAKLSGDLMAEARAILARNRARIAGAAMRFVRHYGGVVLMQAQKWYDSSSVLAGLGLFDRERENLDVLFNLVSPMSVADAAAAAGRDEDAAGGGAAAAKARARQAEERTVKRANANTRPFPKRAARLAASALLSCHSVIQVRLAFQGNRLKEIYESCLHLVPAGDAIGFRTQASLELNLARDSLRRTGGTVEARKHVDKARAAAEQAAKASGAAGGSGSSSGSGDPLLGDICSVEAAIAQAEGDPRQAAAKYEEALARHRAAYGEASDHPELATTYSNVATAMATLDRLPAARAMYDKALRIRELRYGPKHPVVADTLNNIGNVLDELGESAAAIDHFHRALEIRKAVFGPDAVEVATVKNNLGLALHAANETAEALKMFEEARIIREHALGRDHASVAQTHNNIGRVYMDQHSFTKAREAWLQAKTIFTRALRSNHPTVAVTIMNLGLVDMHSGRLKDARGNFTKALESLRAAYKGAANASIGDCLFNLGVCEGADGHNAKAMEYLTAARTEYRQVYPEDHPSIVQTLSRMAAQAEAENRLGDASALRSEASSLRLRSEAHHAAAATASSASE